MRSSVLFAALVACATLAGCYSRATGYGGKLTFGYASGVEVENFVKPIAPGAKLDVVAFANGSSERLTITAATSSRPDVVEIDAVRDKVVVLRAREQGLAEIEITAQDAGGATRVDKMFFHVAKPAKHGLEHGCTAADEAAYVRGEEVTLFHGMKTDDGRNVVGYGYAPLTIEPAGILELVDQPQSFPLYAYKAKRAGSVSVRSTIDGEALTVRIVEPGEPSKASLDYSDRMLEGHDAWVVAHVRLEDVELCSQNALTKARSLTPEICTVTARLDDDPNGGDSNRAQLAIITAKKFGVCKFELTLPELAGGKGVVLPGETRIGRMEFPGDRGLLARVRDELTSWPSVARDALAFAALVVVVLARRRSAGSRPPAE